MKLAALLFLGMTAIAQAEDAHRPLVGRSLVATRYGIVRRSQPLAARAGMQILERGGNAVDAAIATNAAIGPDGADRATASAAISSRSSRTRRPASSTA